MGRVKGAVTIGGAAIIVAALCRFGDSWLFALGRTLAPLLHIDPRVLFLVVSLNIVSYLLAGSLWTRLAGALGHKLPFRAGLAAYLSAGIGGYVLTAAGPAVGCALAVRRYGISAGRAVLLSLLASALGFCGLLAWAPIGLFALERAGLASRLPILRAYGPFVAMALWAGLVVGMFLVLRALAGAPATRLRIARRLLGEENSSDGPVPSMSQLVALAPWAAATWFAGVLTLYVMLSALSPTAAHQPLLIIGSAAIAGTLGSLAFFVPHGLGVQDGVLLTLLAHGAGLPVAQTITVLVALRILDPVTKVGVLVGLGLYARLPWPARSADYAPAPTAMCGVGRPNSIGLTSGRTVSADPVVSRTELGFPPLVGASLARQAYQARNDPELVPATYPARKYRSPGEAIRSAGGVRAPFRLIGCAIQPVPPTRLLKRAIARG